MQGVGCITIIIVAVLWAMVAAFLGIGMPLIGMLAAVMIWRVSPAFALLLGGISGLALGISVPMYFGFIDKGTDNQGYVFLAIMQALITALLLAYAWFGDERRTSPRSGGYDVAMVGGLLGLTANAFVFGVTVLIDVLGG